ncbi:MAG: hypothetical protein LBK73_14205 [Treponema sp.]|jgi:hypothetical protein|nr:hypothetical protein [Treponema sp.]
MRAFLLRLGVQFNIALTFCELYSVVMVYLQQETDYHVHRGIDIGLSISSAMFIYLSLNLMIAIVRHPKGAASIVVLYGCAATVFVQPSSLPLKWFFWCPLGVLVMAIAFVLAYIISNNTKKGMYSILGWLLLISPVFIQMFFYSLALANQWGWLIEGVVEALKWLGASTGFIAVSAFLVKFGKLNDKLDKFVIKLAISSISAIITGEILYGYFFRSFVISALLFAMIIIAVIFILEKRRLAR